MLNDFQLFEKLCEGQPYLSPEVLYSYRIVQNPSRKRDTNAVLLISNLVRNARKGDYRARTWGYTVVRTAYDNDAKFRNALTPIRWARSATTSATGRWPAGTRYSQTAGRFWRTPPSASPSGASSRASCSTPRPSSSCRRRGCGRHGVGGAVPAAA
ncbi:hypothetical protein PG988_011846 [Apiospora saccharicola]